MTQLELFEELIDLSSELEYKDSSRLDFIRKRSEMVIRRAFGEKSKYINDLNDVYFHPMFYPCSPEEERAFWKSGKDQFINLFNTIIEEIQLFGLPGETENESHAKKDKSKETGEIFIVHGHDNTMKAEVARTIERIGLKPIILHEQPNKGRTIIEKFTDIKNVGFAIVLLSPDDIAYSKQDSHSNAKFRARQNVILELGYFLGKLGRERVLALYKNEDNFEMPSDYSGVLFTSYDSGGRWMFDLVKELKACGYDVDANNIL